MMIGLLWIFGIYGLSVALMHLIHWSQLRKGRPRAIRHIVLVKNNQHHVEWFLRCLLFFSYWRGRYVTVTVFDEGAGDDTMAIVRHFAERYDNIDIGDAGEDLDAFIDNHAEERIIVTRLSHLHGPARLSMPQW